MYHMRRNSLVTSALYTYFKVIRICVGIDILESEDEEVRALPRDIGEGVREVTSLTIGA